MRNKLLTATQFEKIQLIVSRLENSISELKIRNWLEQFSVKDWDSALEVLSKLEYYSSKRIMHEYNEEFFRISNKINTIKETDKEQLVISPTHTQEEKILIKHKQEIYKKTKNNVFLHPIGELGKSGSMVLYYATHTPFYSDSNWTILKNINEIEANNIYETLHLVLLDDFSGSGGTIYKYLINFIKPALKKNGIRKIHIHILCVVYMHQARHFVEQKTHTLKISFYGTERTPAFSSNGSPFGYRPKMLKIREFCYKYGNNLFTETKYVKRKGKKTRKFIKHPLGYENSQSLVVFEHSTPNNTLPIIWSSKRKWLPLFPRVPKTRIQENVKFKNQTKIWLSIAKKLGYNNIFGEEESIYKSENIKLLCYIRYIKRGLIRPLISQNLNLSSFELNKIIEIGINRKVLINENKLSIYGEKLYSEVLKKVKFSQEKQIKSVDNIIYIPKIFRGKT